MFLPDSFVVASPGACGAADFAIAGPATFGFFHLSGGISVIEDRLDRSDRFASKTPRPPSRAIEWYVNISNATAPQRAFALTVSERPRQHRDSPFRQAFTKRSNVTVLCIMKPHVRPRQCRKATTVASTVTAIVIRLLAPKSRTSSAGVSANIQRKVPPDARFFISVPLTRLTAVGIAVLAVVTLVVCVVAGVVTPAGRTRRDGRHSDLT
jgi:hypothetical protein